MNLIQRHLGALVRIRARARLRQISQALVAIGGVLIVSSGMADTPVQNESQILLPEEALGGEGAGSGLTFGYAVDVDGNTAIIGAETDDDVGGGRGSAYIFVRGIDGWTEQAKIVPAELDGSARFGYSVAVDGDTVAISAPDFEGPDELRPGATFIYVRSGDVWTQQARIDSITVSRWVDLDGNTLVLSGGHVYTRNAGAWVWETQLPNCGIAVIDSDTIACAISAGIYVYIREAGTWTEQDVLPAGSTGAFSIDGDTLLSGMRVFIRREGAWSQQATLQGSDSEIGDGFGCEGTITGDRIVLVAPADSTGPVINHGSAYAFRRFGDSWTEVAKFVASDKASGDFLGAPCTRIGLNSDTALVGTTTWSADDTLPIPGSGAVYAFDFPSSLTVRIDIKPGTDPNSINLKSKQNIPVAILTTDTFDATQVDWETVLFGPNGATESHGRSHVEDVDDDGDMDMLLHFRVQEAGITCGDKFATLIGETFASDAFAGADSVKIVKCADPPNQPPLDTTPPVITLVGDNPQVIAVGEAYVELGAIALDNRDGDLSASIVIDTSAIDSSAPGEYAVTYDVSDYSGNAAVTAIRTVIYEDQTPPVITLLGANPQIIILGNPYVELGATAIDNVDGDLTDDIIVNTDALDPASIGDYEVAYDVSDAAGNAAQTVTRIVSIQPPLPDKASVTVEGDIKKLIFSWQAVPFTDYYRLLENADGHSGFTQVGDDLAPDALSASRDVAVHLFDWDGAQYMVEACNVTGCNTSDIVSVTDVMLDTIGYFKASNTEPYISSLSSDRFGSAVAVSADGTTLAVGAPDEDSCATGIDGDQNNNSCEKSGAVYLYRLGESGWYQQAYIKASNTDASDNFGRSNVALSGDGNALAVGAGSEDSCATGLNGDAADNSCDAAGAVYLFRFANDQWYQEAYVKASNTDAGDSFGGIGKVALSNDGNTLAVGASGEDSSATGINGDQANNSMAGAGAVYLFRYENEAWYQSDYIKASNNGFGQQGPYGTWDTGGFASTVALDADGDTLIVDARVGLYVLRYDGTAWLEEAYLNWILWADRISDMAVDAAGNTVAVARLNEYFGGSVNVYRFENNSWVLYSDIWRRPMSDPDVEQYLEPQSLAFSADGQWLVVGVFMDYWDGPSLVDLLRANGQNWDAHNLGILAPNFPYFGGDLFGSEVALSADGNTLAVGAPQEASCATGINGNQDDDSCYGAGAVYLY